MRAEVNQKHLGLILYGQPIFSCNSVRNFLIQCSDLLINNMYAYICVLISYTFSTARLLLYLERFG